MKSNKIIALLGLALLVVTVAFSCQKSRYCLCVSQDSWHTDTVSSYNNETGQTETTYNDFLYRDTIIVNVDNGMSCKGIHQLGVMKQVATEDGGALVVDSVYEFVCTKIKKDSLGNYNNLHLQQ